MARSDGDLQKIERRSLNIGKWGNLFMGAAGVLAAWLSNSQALLVDGLFSLIGFASAVLGAIFGPVFFKIIQGLREKIHRGRTPPVV